MRQEDILKEKYGTDAGFRVPDGYFDNLNSAIMSKLPDYPEVEHVAPLSVWQRVKPYVYLAAMFAGIWMMMKVFHTVSTADRLSLDNPPEAIVQLLESDGYEAIVYGPTESEFELEKEVSESYESFDDFQDDFGYNLSPEYESMRVSAIVKDSSHG